MRDPRLTIAFLLRLSYAVIFSFGSFAFVASAQTPHKPASASSAQTIASAQSGQIYRNTTFGFRFQIPYGWVDRTKQIRDQSASQPPDSATANGSAPSSSQPQAKEKSSSQSDVLLAIFERPPDAPGDSVNSAVVIASESAASYPGLKKAQDYLAPLTELTTAKGFQPDGDPEIAQVDSHQLLRANFAKPIGANKNGDPLTMHQSTLILLAKGQIVSFTFIAGSEDEIDDLIDGLHFATGRPSPVAGH
jgi:hypothetical protein